MDTLKRALSFAQRHVVEICAGTLLVVSVTSSVVLLTLVLRELEFKDPIRIVASIKTSHERPKSRFAPTRFALD